MKKFFFLVLGFVLPMFVNAQSKAAFLSTFTSLSDLQSNGDDDEIAAAEWFVNVYGGDFLPVSDVKTTDLSQYNVIWLAIERPFGFTTNFPTELLAQDVLSAMQGYYKSGGNFLFTNYAIKYLNELGRCQNNLWPELWEDGSDLPDDNLAAWGPISTFGKFFANHPDKSIVDRSSDRLWEGLMSEVRTTTETWNQSETTYIIYPLIGAGQKEVHRVTWSMDCDLNAGLEGSIDNPEFLSLFEEAYNVEAIGAFEYTLAYHRMSVARWWPQGDYQGKAITINDTGYEWHQNSGENLYQANIERLTENALNELGGASSSSLGNIDIQGLDIQIRDDKIFLPENCNSISLYGLNGCLLKVFDGIVVNDGVDIADLSKGVYLLRCTDEYGNLVTGKFMKD